MEGGNRPLQPNGLPTDRGGGYDIGKAKIYNTQNSPVNIAELNALKCSKCALILREPCQVISCGHRYCRSCIDQVMNGGDGPYYCAIDNERFRKDQVRSDKGCLRDLDGLNVDCPNDPQCSWRGKLLDIEVHREACPNKTSVCSHGCGGSYLSANMETHMSSECPKRPYTCQYCKGSTPFDVIKEHYKVCQEHPVMCDCCHKDIPARKQLAAHLEQECEESIMKCSNHLCEFEGRRSELMKHVMAKHFLQYVQCMAGMERKLVSIASDNSALRRDLTESLSKVSNLEAQTAKLAKENMQKDLVISGLKSRVEELEKERDERYLAMVKGGHGRDMLEKDGPNRGDEDLYKKRRIVSKVRVADQPDLLDSAPHYTTRDIQFKSLGAGRAHHEPVNSLTGVALDAPRPMDVDMKQEMEVVQSKIRKLNDAVQATQENQTRYGGLIDDIRLRQDVLDVKTTNGVLIWKIPDIRRRYRDALDRRTISLYSPPFYTSPHGYRMCIRVYLNGDGTGKGTHVSLFFVVMRSEHDNLLPWPFKQSVRFTLINQKNPGDNITEAFVPDLGSPSFHKPENDMNIASGFPKFTRQIVLNDDSFTQGDMIFIKCQVDHTGIPTH